MAERCPFCGRADLEVQCNGAAKAAACRREREEARIERETDALIGDVAAMRRVFRHAYRMAAQRHQRQPLWVFAKELFVTGSTYAFVICRKLGFDPEAAGRAALAEPNGKTGGEDA